MAAFRNWGDFFGPRAEIHLIQMPGREHRWRERPACSIRELVPPLAAAVSRCSDRQIAFYGHSIGARVAYEVARELNRAGLAKPVHLFVGACPAPHIPWDYPPVRDLSAAELIAEVGRRYGELPAVVLEDAELRQLVVQTLRADFSLIETHGETPITPLDCPVTAFAGVHDRAVKLSHVEAWQLQTTSSFRLHTVPGDHFFLQNSPQGLLGMIADALPERALSAAYGWTGQ